MGSVLAASRLAPALLASCMAIAPGAASAASLVWGGGDGNWKTAANWSPATKPGLADTASIDSGTVTVNDAQAAGTVQFTGGTLFVKGAGALTIKNLLNITGGLVKGDGTITLTGGSAPAVTQSGGGVSGNIVTPNYTLSGGKILDTGVIDFSASFSQTGGVVVDGATITGTGGSATMSLSGDADSVVMSGTVTGIIGFTQSGGKMAGTVTTTNYSLSGGQVSGSGTEVKFSGKFDQTGGLVAGAATLTGSSGATVSLSGDSTSIMAGKVNGIADFVQSGGKMGGVVTTKDYTMSGGRIDATGITNFSGTFAMSGGGLVAGSQFKGGNGSVATLSDADGTASMNGTVTGVAKFTQTGGDMGGSVTTTDYELSGGSINDAGTSFGSVDFTDDFTFSGGEIEANTSVTGGVGSTLTQSGGKLSGVVEVANYDLTSALAEFASTGSISATDSFGIGPSSGTLDIAALFTGTGDLTKTGASSVRLSNAGNNYSGDTVIDAGLLSLTGTLGGMVTVHDGGTFGGNASVGATTVDAGGTLAPGNSIGTMTVASLDMAAGSTYNVEIDALGNSDKTIVTGLAKLAGTVNVVAAGGSYLPTSTYTILSAGSLEGKFDDDVSIDLAFLAPRLEYAGGDVLLKLIRNDIDFESVGDTANQKSVAAALELAGPASPIYDAAIGLTSGEARAAFDALSGEAYVSSSTALLQNSNILADLTLGRVSGALSQDGVAPAHRVWGQAYGGFGSISGNGASELDTRTGGVAGGFDGTLGDWLFGVMAQAGATRHAVSALATTLDSTDYGVGLYGGGAVGPLQMALGALYSRHDIDASRAVDFPGFTDSLSASYSADTAQAFARLSYGMQFDDLSVSPFIGLAYVDQATDGLSETGGAAALSGDATNAEALFSTLGIGFSQRFATTGAPLTLGGSIGWRHAFGGGAEGSFALVDSDDFAAAGAPVAADQLVIGGNLSLELNPATVLDFSYDGQIDTDATAHAVRAAFSHQF